MATSGSGPTYASTFPMPAATACLRSWLHLYSTTVATPPLLGLPPIARVNNLSWNYTLSLAEFR